MEIAIQIVSVILIIGAVLLFLKRSSRNTMITKFQKTLAVFQIVLCGSFFALCLSDVLDIRVSFSAVRVFLNVFYAPVGFEAEKAKAYPNGCLLLRRPDCSAVLCFPV